MPLWRYFAFARLTAMSNFFFMVTLLIGLAGLSGWLWWRLVSFVRADGYGSPVSPGGLSDWGPRHLPSTPYSLTPPR